MHLITSERRGLQSPCEFDKSVQREKHARKTIQRVQGQGTKKRRRDPRILPALEQNPPVSMNPALGFRALQNAPRKEIRVVKLPNGEFYAFLGVRQMLRLSFFFHVAKFDGSFKVLKSFYPYFQLCRMMRLPSTARLWVKWIYESMIVIRGVMLFVWWCIVFYPSLTLFVRFLRPGHCSRTVNGTEN